MFFPFSKHVLAFRLCLTPAPLRTVHGNGVERGGVARNAFLLFPVREICHAHLWTLELQPEEHQTRLAHLPSWVLLWK